MEQRALEILLKNEESKKLAGLFYNNPVEKYSLRIGILCIIFAMPLVYFDLSRILGGLMSLTGAALLIIYSLASFLHNLPDMLTPAKSYFKDLTKRIDAENDLVAELAALPINQLEITRKRLQFEKEKITSRICFLVGAIDKLGIIPAVLALYFTYIKTLDGSKLEALPYPVLSFIAGIYIGCILLKHVLDQIEHTCFAIEVAVERVKENSNVEPMAVTSGIEILSPSLDKNQNDVKR